jgi:hypothetical protein
LGSNAAREPIRLRTEGFGSRSFLAAGWPSPQGHAPEATVWRAPIKSIKFQFLARGGKPFISPAIDPLAGAKIFPLGLNNLPTFGLTA